MVLKGCHQQHCNSQHLLKPMKLTKTLTIALAALLTAVFASNAATINLQFSYEDSNGLVSGDATLEATPLFDVPGGYIATAGTLMLTAPAKDQISGDYQLFPNPQAPSAQYSPTGQFIYDDQVFPGGSPMVTNPGLLAFGGKAAGNVPEGKGSELNLFSSGPNTYNLYTATNGNYPYSFQFTVTPASSKMNWSNTVAGAGAVGMGTIHASVVAAPEPSTWVIMGSFLVIALFKTGSLRGAREQA